MDALQADIARRLKVADADVVDIVRDDDGNYCVTLCTGAKVCVVVEQAKVVEPVIEPVIEIVLPPSIASGNSDAVLKWVGNNHDKASAALEHERTKGKPRVVLIKQLEGVLDGR